MIRPLLFSLLKYLSNPESVLSMFSSFKLMSSTRRPHGERPRRLYGNHKRIRVVPVTPIVSKISEKTGATRTTIWKPGFNAHKHSPPSPPPPQNISRRREQSSRFLPLMLTQFYNFTLSLITFSMKLQITYSRFH